MSDTPMDRDDIHPDDIDPNDEQAIAEGFDEENLEPDIDVEDWGPDHGLAVREASVVLPTGEVPVDSIAEREWREEPDRLTPDTRGLDEEIMEPNPDFGLDPDFAAESAAEFAHEQTPGLAVGEMAGPVEGLLPAEEAAIHFMSGDEPDDF